MDRERAEALAALVRATTGHETRTVPDGASFAVDVQVRPQDDGEPGTWTLYDEDDWACCETESDGERSNRLTVPTCRGTLTSPDARVHGPGVVLRAQHDRVPVDPEAARAGRDQGLALARRLAARWA
jgi:hypothetical protein